MVLESERAILGPGRSHSRSVGCRQFLVPTQPKWGVNPLNKVRDDVPPSFWTDSETDRVRCKTMAGGTDNKTQECKPNSKTRASHVFRVCCVLGFCNVSLRPLVCIFGVRVFAFWSFCSGPDLSWEMHLLGLDSWVYFGLGIERTLVAKRFYSRSPVLHLVDLFISFRAGAVGNGPGPNFGWKPAQRRPKTKYRFKFSPRSSLTVAFGSWPRP